MSEENTARVQLLTMTAQVAASYFGNNVVPATQIPEVIKSVYGSLASLDGQSDGTGQSSQKPAVPIRRSVTPDFVICLEDGKKLKMLKRHLRTTYGLTPEEYRVKWGLPPDYPMVAPNYAKQRSNFAKKIGLGRKPRTTKRRRKK
ncbi:MAG: MucR family transcriptional regulator [Alphaproteobacteria bacterium]|nr:MucR family transcriptional regulator [Alphaproteobacteria bacterium]